jgi:type I restriction enzyme S subunit
MPEPNVTLSELVDRGEVSLGRGEIISTNAINATPGDYPVYSSSAVGAGEFGRYGKYMFDEELITWSVDGGGRPFYRTKHRFSVTNVYGFLRIKDRDRWNYRYFHAAMELQHARLSFDYQLKAHPSVIKKLYTFVRLPFRRQQRIAEILSTIDEAIEQTEALIGKTQQIKAGLMHDLFTRGVTPDGQLRPPREEAPQLYKESPLGWIPKEWEVTTLGTCSEFVTSGSRGWGAYYVDEGPLFVRIGNLTREHPNLRLYDLVHVRPPLSSEGQRTRLIPGDLLMSITADLGIVGVVPAELGEAYVNQHIALVRVKSVLAASRWLGHWLGGPQAQAIIRRFDDPGAKAGLNLPTVRTFPVLLPSRDERGAAEARLDSADGAIRAAQISVQKLRVLKAGLMHDLLTGRVRVPVADVQQPDRVAASA